MANSTDPFANAVHGTNPQYLIEKITRLKIYNSVYWKEECFGLTAATIIDKAVELKYYGGTYGGTLQPSKFLCLLLKCLQLQPEKDIIYEFIKNEDFPYLRILGAFYLRLTGKSEEIYTYLEPLYNDYRRIIYRTQQEFTFTHVDEVIDALLREELVCDVALPHLMKRIKLEELNTLPPRKSALEDELDFDEESDNNEDAGERAEDNHKTMEVEKVEQSAVAFEDEEEDEAAENVETDKMETVTLRKDVVAPENGATHAEETKAKAKASPQYGSRSPSPRDRREKYEFKDRYERKRSRSRDRDSRSRRRSSYSDSDESDSEEDRKRRKHRRRSNSRRRDYRSRSRSPRSRDRHYRRRDERRSRDRRSRDRYRPRDDSPDREGYRRDKDRRSLDREEKGDVRRAERQEKVETEEEVVSGMNATSQLNAKQKKNEKIFDKIFGKKKSSGGSSGPGGNTKVVGKEIIGANGQKVVITAPEGTIEYWNQIRESLGMKKLK